MPWITVCSASSHDVEEREAESVYAILKISDYFDYSIINYNVVLPFICSAISLPSSVILLLLLISKDCK